MNYLNDCREKRIVYQLELSLQTVRKGFGFPGVRESLPWCDQGRWWFDDSHHPFSHLPQWLVFWIKAFQRVAPPVIPPLVKLVGHQPLQSLAFNAGSQGIFHCLPDRFYRRISSWIRIGNGGLGLVCWRHFGVESVSVFEMALDSSLTHASIVTSFGRSGLEGSPASSQAWNLGQSVLKSGRSGGLRKEERHCVSISIGKWSELSAEHVVRHTGEARSFVITMSRTSGLAKRL